MTSTDTPLPESVPRGDCILFATADWDTPYWTNKQHTAAQLAKSGWRVLYVESVGLRAPKMGSGTDWRRILKRLWRGLKGPRKVQERVWVLSPLVIPLKHHHPWVRRFNQGLLAWTVARFCRQQEFRSPLLWTYHPYLLEQLTLMREHHGVTLGKLVYHCVDDLSAIPGIDAEAFNAEERRLLLEADVVFTTSESLAAKCAPYNSRVHNFPNVVDIEHFSAARQSEEIPADLRRIPSPRIGYMGALSDFKVDFKLLRDVALTHPTWHLVLIGEEREGQTNPALAAIATLPNVHLLGHKRYDVLPKYLRGIDVGMLPTLINEYTRSMFPMKYFEYIASGVPVVATPLEFTRNIKHFLITAADASSFSDAIQHQLNRGRINSAEARDVIGDNTWSQRLEKMLNTLQQN